MKLSKEQKLIIYNRYLNGETLLNLSKEFNISVQTLYNYYRKHNLKTIVSKNKRSRKHKVEDLFFNIIDSEKKAYILGFLLADGYVSHKNKKLLPVIGLKLQISDINHLKLIKDYMCKDTAITIENNSCSFSIRSKSLFEDLEKLNCVEHKTYKSIRFPNINSKYFRDLIRGYFDADGSIGIRSERPNQVLVNICSINKVFLEDIQKILQDISIETTITEEIREGKLLKLPKGISSLNCKNMYRIIPKGHINTLKFYEYLYKDSNIYLDRKLKKYKEYYVNTVLTMQNKNCKAVQRVDTELSINYELLNDFDFRTMKHLPNFELVYKLFYIDKMPMTKISKELGYDRSYLKEKLLKYIEKYNVSKSVPHLTE